MYALDAATGRPLPGFPWFSADSGFSTPAIADLYGNGRNEVVVGGDQTAGLAYGTRYTQGGHLRVLVATGNAGTGRPAGGLDCQYDPDQVVESSPVVGPFLAGGRLGTGGFWPGATATDTVFALGTRCQPAWSAHLDGLTGSSPALADLGLGGLSRCHARRLRQHQRRRGHALRTGGLERRRSRLVAAVPPRPRAQRGERRLTQHSS